MMTEREDGSADETGRHELLEQLVQRILRRRSAVFGARSIDVALGGHHRFVAEQFHQRVDADVLVGETGREGVPQAMDEYAAGALAVDARLLEGAQHPVLQRSAGDAFAIAAHEQWGSGRPPAEAGLGGASFGGTRKSGGAAVQVGDDDVDGAAFQGDSTIFVALAAHVEDAVIVVDDADVADVGVDQLLGAGAPASRAVKTIARSRSTHSERLGASRSPLIAVTNSATVSVASPLGTLGRPISGIGLASKSSAV